MEKFDFLLGFGAAGDGVRVFTGTTIGGVGEPPDDRFAVGLSAFSDIPEENRFGLLASLVIFLSLPLSSGF